MVAEQEIKAIHVIVSGKVQGVSYRQSTQEAARSLGLTGWVKNLPDRRVELVAQGNEAALEKLVSWLNQGPPMAEVTDLEVNPCKLAEFVEFSVEF